MLGEGLLTYDGRRQGKASGLSADQPLSKEHGLVSCLVKGLEEVAKADPAIRVDAPHVDFWQRIRRLIKLLDVTKNRRNRVAGVVPPDNSSHVPNLTNGVKKAAAHVQPVVVPLVANASLRPFAVASGQTHRHLQWIKVAKSPPPVSQ